MRRPKEHPRRVRYGKRRVFFKRKTINQGVHYPVVSKKAKLSQKKKNLFLYISNPKFFKQETGGYIDFNKKDMQRVWMEFSGKKWKDYEIVELPEEKDWEAMWHTHPDTGPTAIMPSDIDLLGFLKDNQDVNLIFVPSGGVLIINRSKRSNLPDVMLKGKIKAKLDVVNKEVSGAKSQKEFILALLKSLKNNFSDMGLRFDYTDAKSLNIPVEVREPRKSFGALIYPETARIESYFKTGRGSGSIPKSEFHALDIVQAFEDAEAIIAQPIKSEDDNLRLKNDLLMLENYKQDKRKLNAALNSIDMMKTRVSHPRYGKMMKDPFPTIKSSLEVKRFIEEKV